jgi:hypothetical protein
MADPIRARCDAADTLVAADEALARLHVAAGGTLPGVLAVPALLALVRQVRASGLAQTRPVLAMDGDCPISFHAHAAPEGTRSCWPCATGAVPRRQMKACPLPIPRRCGTIWPKGMSCWTRSSG